MPPDEQNNQTMTQPSAEQMAAMWAEEAAAGPDQNGAPMSLEQQVNLPPRDDGQQQLPAGAPAALAAPAAEVIPGNLPADQMTEAQLRAHVKELSAQNERLHQSQRNLGGQVGGLKNQMAQLLEQVTAARAASAAAPAGAAVPTQRQISDASKSSAKFAKMMEDFPEIAEAVAEEIGLQVGEVVKKLPAGGAAAPAVDTEQLVDGVMFKMGQRELAKEYPDWAQQVNSARFEAWLPQQPKAVQDMYNSPNPSDAIQCLDLFNGRQRQQAGGPRLTPQARLAQAAAIATGDRSSTIRKDPSMMSPQELWELEAREAERAQR